MALRWSFMGPFETIDLNAPGGVKDYAERYQQIYERLPAADLQRRHAWRDRRLMALIAHKRKAAKDIGS